MTAPPWGHREGNTMLTVSIRHSRDGYHLHVIDAPLWAQAVENATDALCARLGHSLCGARSPIVHRLGQRLFGMTSGRDRELWSTALTDQEAAAIQPWLAEADG